MEPNPANVPTIPVSLTTYEWHMLLEEMSYLLNICNRDSGPLRHVWGRITEQLQGQPVEIR